MLESGNIRLRLIEGGDIEQILDLRNNVALYADDYYPINFTTPAQFMREYDNNSLWAPDSGTMVIVDLDDRLLGEIEFFQSSPCVNGFELGFTIYLPSDRNKGYMRSALPLFCSYLFESRNINRLTVQCITKNLGACRLLETCGFQNEGTLRGAGFHRGEFLDYHIFGLLKNEATPLTELLKI